MSGRVTKLRSRLLLLLASCGLACAQSGNWLDSSLKNWNTPGAELPDVPQPIDWSDVPDICSSLRERPNTVSEEQIVAAKGWLVTGSEIASWAAGPHVVIVSAASNLDGMCRDDRYREFVFVNGTFAGTLSPDLMFARADASLNGIEFQDGGRIVAYFRRYTDNDPLCCPSGKSTVTFEIQKAAGWLVVPVSIKPVHP
jgi:hypothetical protein